MKLSDLVRLRNRIQQLNFQKLRDSLENLDADLSSINSLEMQNDCKNYLDNILSLVDTAEQKLDMFIDNKFTIINNIQNQIDEKAKPFMSLGYKIGDFYGSNLTDVATERNNRQLPITDHERTIIQGVAKSYTNWKYPCLEIGPGDGEWTQQLVGGEPLYIIDRHPEFIDSTKSKFNQMFGNRIRTYISGSAANKPEFDFSELPKNTFGFIFAWNVINHWPFNETKQSLKQFFEMLRPGGTMMFSYNNCDLPECIELVENGFRTYIPKSLLTHAVIEMGFEITNHHSTSIHVHWIEIKKPGTLNSIKLHPTLGKISRATA
jgi:SAM-dependent methyltransferase